MKFGVNIVRERTDWWLIYFNLNRFVSVNVQFVFLTDVDIRIFRKNVFTVIALSNLTVSLESIFSLRLGSLTLHLAEEMREKCIDY